MSTPSQIKADYRAQLALVGEMVTIRRYTGTGTNRPKIDRPVLARIAGYGPTELVGTIMQGDRRVIALADDITQPTTDSPPQTLTLPILTSDKIVTRDGKELQIIASDDSTRRVRGVLIALEIQARG
jgi:hypothetical protein